MILNCHRGGVEEGPVPIVLNYLEVQIKGAEAIYCVGQAVFTNRGEIALKTCKYQQRGLLTMSLVSAEESSSHTELQDWNSTWQPKMELNSLDPSREELPLRRFSLWKPQEESNLQGVLPTTFKATISQNFLEPFTASRCKVKLIMALCTFKQDKGSQKWLRTFKGIKKNMACSIASLEICSLNNRGAEK